MVAGVACLVLLVWLLVHDARIERMKERAQGSTTMERRPRTATRPDAPAQAEANSPVEQLSVGKLTTQPGNPTSVRASDRERSPAANSQEIPIVADTSVTLASRGFSIRNIQPAFAKSPIYVLVDQKAKPFTPRTWLRVVVTFQSPGTRMAELSFRYKISIGDELFTGTISHRGILGEGDHQVAAYVIPSVVEPLIQRPGFIADKRITVEVEALQGDTVLARSQFGQAQIAPRRTRPNLLRSVEQTPFAPLEIDLFEPTAD